MDEKLIEPITKRERFRARMSPLYAKKGDSKPPKAPDYTKAAEATSQGNLAAARAAVAANRVNQYTPYGNLVYSHQGNDPDTGWSSTVTLSPEQQRQLNQSNQLNTGLMGAAQRALGSAQLDNPAITGYDVQLPGNFNQGAPTTGFNPGQSYQDAIMTRLQPQIERENAQLDAQLANQGIMQGSEAYNNAKALQSQRQNDLLTSATVGGLQAGLAANQQAFNQNQAQYQTGLQARGQGFQQGAYNRQLPINLVNALRAGAQVQNPNFMNAPQQAVASGPNYLGAAQGTYDANLNAYNAATGNRNATMGGLFGLGGSLFGAAGNAGGFGNLFGFGS